MWRDVFDRIGRKYASFLALSLVLLAYLSFRDDTSATDLVLGGGFVVALWVLIGFRLTMTRSGQPRTARGRSHAR
jgi:hypothetical protein